MQETDKTDNQLQIENREVSSPSRLQRFLQITLPRWSARLIPGQRKLADNLASERLAHFEHQLVELDRTDSDLAHDLGEVTAQLIRLNHRLKELENLLAQQQGETGQDQSA